MRPFPFLAAASSLLLVGLLFLGPLPRAGAGEHERVQVPAERIRLDDGDSFAIAWDAGLEQVRLLGMDTPEVSHPEHDIPYAQPFGHEASGFLHGCVASAEKLELVRSGEKDPYGRSLCYLYVNGKNYSVLAIRARLAIENVSRYGDNGMPDQAAACLAAAKEAGPLPFEDPHDYRARMRKLSAWLKSHARPAAKGG